MSKLSQRSKELTWKSRSEKLINRVNTAFPNPTFENWNLCEELELSANAACKQVNEFKIENKIAVSLLDRTADYLSAKASYTSSFPIYKVGVETRENIFDVLDWSTTQRTAKAKSIGNTETSQTSIDILDIWDKVLQKGHPFFASNLNEINYSGNSSDAYSQALPLYLKALVIKERILDKYHPSIATSLNNLAELYRKQGESDYAELLHRKSLTISKKNLNSKELKNKTIDNSSL